MGRQRKQDGGLYRFRPDRFQARRRELNLSISDVQQKMVQLGESITAGALAFWESGLVKNPHPGKVCAAAEALGVTPDFFYAKA